MQKRTGSLTAVLGAVLLSAFPALLHAQATPGAGTAAVSTAAVSTAAIGPVNLTWGAPGRLVGDHLLLLGGVHMTSTDYDLTAQTVDADLQSGNKGGGAFSIIKATAEGNPAKGTQVTGRFASPALARTYLVDGDHAVYTPDPSRPDGAKIDFTGHVVIRVTAPDSLNGDAVTHVEHATVLLGKSTDAKGGDAYPQIEFSAGHLEFTPLQKEH